MSYTAPTNVQTKADAVLALASTIAGEDKTGMGDGSVNTALDVLADVLAGQDVEVPQTNAGAILALAQYVGGGGGSSTQTLTVTKSDESDTVLVTTMSWADYIAGTGAPTEIQPDSTDGLVSVYSIPVGAFFFAIVNGIPAATYFDAEMTKGFSTQVMPSTPLYAMHIEQGGGQS